jgi:hypothetical protein
VGQVRRCICLTTTPLGVWGCGGAGKTGKSQVRQSERRNTRVPFALANAGRMISGAPNHDNAGASPTRTRARLPCVRSGDDARWHRPRTDATRGRADDVQGDGKPERRHLARRRGKEQERGMELATTTGTEQHDRVITVSDLNDRWPTDDADVIAVLPKEGKEVAQVPTHIVALVPVVDLTRVAANIMRVVDDAGLDRGDVAGPNGPAPPSSGSQALALMPMFDLDREPL